MTRKALLFGMTLLAMSFATDLCAEDVTLEGSFVWVRDDQEQTGDLQAVFSPTGDGAWDVAFRFDWEGEPHVFAGTASGTLGSGEMKGKVTSDQEDHKLTFQFEGTFQDGTFTGTHGYFNRDGKLRPSGTLTLQSRT